MKKRTILAFYAIAVVCSLIIPAGWSRSPAATSQKINENIFTTVTRSWSRQQPSEDTTAFQHYFLYTTMEEISVYPSQKKAPPQISIVDIPDAFSWLNYEGQDWTTPAKHQGPIGSCWDFAALAILESIIEIRESCSRLNPDLSEQYVLSCIDGAGSAHGGNPYAALDLLMDTSPDGNNCNGIIPESCFPYQADDRIPCSDKCDEWEESLIPLLDCGYWFSSGNKEDRDIIKAWIVEHGPVVSFIDASDFFKIWGAYHHDSDDYFRFYRFSPMVNHVIQIAGWKDDSSIPRGGYWICKNSWGTNWGYDGFFNIAYGALNVGLGNIIWVDYDPEAYNWPPVPALEELHRGFSGETITFDASQSFDPEGPIVSYEWDLGDSTMATGVQPVHTYDEPGAYQVVLTIEDEMGKTTEITSWVRIQDAENSAPFPPEINGPSSGNVGEELTYRFSTSDPEEDQLLYYIEWHDRESTGWMGPYSSDEVIQLTHTWGTIETFELRVKAMDIYGAESDWTTLEVSIQRGKAMTVGLCLQWLMDLCPQTCIRLYPLITNS
jgi:C1A family cysteine protease